MDSSAQNFKATLSRWASGVSVITYQSPSKKGGLTVSSFSSLSLDPPLVLFCLLKGSQAKEEIESAQAFCVNILKSEQKQISADFASGSLDKAEVLDALSPIQLKTGAPVLPQSLANLDCRLHQMIEAGDHWIVIGKVEDTKWEEGSPLLYFNRNYHTIT
ncbi:flavin reductase-like protein [Leptospira ryugenii]|uniref:Flavin reductase-like protein n=1 Tax=Leptospira ryugenii TaxID=1917863 RepID=A0A2P2DYD6_9LEPT|nr:flavin reductase family protein [Leptospira ryugenii]GBF49648.1 flavin reductase-like protein [Leptospira ryugenii]